MDMILRHGGLHTNIYQCNQGSYLGQSKIILSFYIFFYFFSVSFFHFKSILFQKIAFKNPLPFNLEHTSLFHIMVKSIKQILESDVVLISWTAF